MATYIKDRYHKVETRLQPLATKLRPYFPHLREIDEEEQHRILLERVAAREKREAKENHDLGIIAPVVLKEPEWEIRDEANRKWWALFNEYEYKQTTALQAKKRKWWAWFEETDTPEEKRLIIKLDILLCFFSFVMYWVKYLDQSNVNNAYVSGMKEELGMKGNDLVNTQVVYTVGSVVFQLPMMYLVHRMPCNLLVPLMDFGWGLFTLAIYRANSVGELQAYRFFVGVFESAFYPTIHYLLGSWYKPSEYARRGSIYYFGQMLGLLTAGLLQSAAYEHLHMTLGISGWRWMFILDTVCSLPIAIYGIWSIPGLPKKCYSIFLTDEDIYIARKRLTDANISMDTTKTDFFNKDLWKEILCDWKYYSFVFLNILLWNNSNGSSGAYLLWLKSLNEYSIPMINKLSTITPALGIVWIYMTGAISDLGRSRWGAVVFSQSINCAGNIILAVWDLPKGAIWFAFCLQYFGWAVASIDFAWAADATRHNPQVRAITAVSMNMFGQATTAFTSVLVWKTVEAPRYLKGYSFTATSAFVMIIWASVILPLYKKDERKHAHENGILLYNSALGELPPVPPTEFADLSNAGKNNTDSQVESKTSSEKL